MGIIKNIAGHLESGAVVDVWTATEKAKLAGMTGIATGFVFSFDGDTPPDNCLENDGSDISMTTYETLYDHRRANTPNTHGINTGVACTFTNATNIVNAVAHGLANDDIIEFTTDNTLPAELTADTKYFVVNKADDTFQVSLTKAGAVKTFTDNGTGSHKFHNEFALADDRGEHLRAWDHGRGVDSGRALGSTQGDTMQGHWHNNYTQNALTDTVGTSRPFNDISAVLTNNSNSIVRNPVTDGVNGTPRTAAETRGRNRAYMVCIKY